jgi:hypothetical protein
MMEAQDGAGCANFHSLKDSALNTEPAADYWLAASRHQGLFFFFF